MACFFSRNVWSQNSRKILSDSRFSIATVCVGRCPCCVPVFACPCALRCYLFRPSSAMKKAAHVDCGRLCAPCFVLMLPWLPVGSTRRFWGIWLALLGFAVRLPRPLLLPLALPLICRVAPAGFHKVRALPHSVSLGDLVARWAQPHVVRTCAGFP